MPGGIVMYSIRILHGQQTLATLAHPSEVQLCYRGAYQPGDTVEFESESHFVIVGLDHTLPAARLYLPDKRWVFHLPLAGDLPAGYPPFAFQGDCHLLTLREDTQNEYRNLACNPADQRMESGAYPHCSANVETRDESVFFARNTIDSLHIANGHGQWPWLSWGVGERKDAVIRLDLGREVSVDTLTVYLRADFPHDGYWVQGTVHLSDGYEKTFPLRQFDGPQEITLDGFHTVTWAQLDHLTQSETQQSHFPSLRQLELYGRDTRR